jgi:hypothetical protein
MMMIPRTMRCAICQGEYEGDDVAPIGEEGAAFFRVRPNQFVCFWCMRTWSIEPHEPYWHWVGHA